MKNEILNSKLVIYCIAAMFCLFATLTFFIQNSLCAEENARVKVAILEDNLPGADTVLHETIVGALKAKNFMVTEISFEQVASQTEFNASLYDCLVLTHSHNFTNTAKENIFGFIKNGGDLVLAGGHGFIQKRSMEFPAFSDYEAYTLEGIQTIATYPNQQILDKALSISGKFKGTSAVGFTTRAQSKFVPILSALDRYGRVKGWACGLMINYAGEYKGSNWLLFGISTHEFYKSEAFSETLGAILLKMKYGNLAAPAEKESKEALAETIALKTPAPTGFIRKSADGKHLVYPDGRRFFITGCNYHRSLDMLFWNDDTFDAAVFEDDFRKMRDAGMNCARICVAEPIYDSPEKLAGLKECARKYGIYLLISVRWGTQDKTSEELAANAEKVAELFKDEPMVLGYDLQNEPALMAIASIKFGGERSPALKLNPYEKYADKFDRAALDKRLESVQFRVEGLDNNARKNLAALNEVWGKAVENLNRGAVTTYPGLVDRLWVKPEWRELFDAVNETFNLWIKIQIAAIRKYDTNHLITVGYNQILSCLPACDQLDFVSVHLYDNPPTYENVMTNVTTLDRLSKVWQNKPITVGEFGYSNGIVTPDGTYLDLYSSALTEMITFLYPLAHDYEGSKKWMLTDWHWTQINWGRDWAQKVYESRFGFYAYDGTLQGRAKPLCSALKFLRDYVDNGGAGGTLEIKRGKMPFIPCYIYKGKNALFIGDVKYKSPQFEFNSKQPANVMLTFEGTEIKLMSSADAAVRITPSDFIPQVTAAKAKILGKYGSLKREGNSIRVDVLEGETVVLK